MANHRPSGAQPPQSPGSSSTDVASPRDATVGSPPVAGSTTANSTTASSVNPGSAFGGSGGTSSGGAEPPSIEHSSTSVAHPSGASVAPVVSLVERRDREKQEQIDRLLEMLDDLRQDVVAGRVSALAVAGVADGEEFCQWEGQDATLVYVLELTKAEILHGVRFGDADDDEEDEDS